MTDRQDIEARELIQSGYRYALSLTHNEHDAEDLVQQACVRVLRSRGRLVSRPYLFTTVRNLFVDNGRQKADRVQSLEDTDERPSKIDHEKQVDDRQEVDRLLSRLRPEEREVLYLNCVEGFTAREIGKLTGSPRGTVLSLISRAKAKLSDRKANANERGGTST